MRTDLDLQLNEFNVSASGKYVMPIYGNRPGDNAARQPKLAETLPLKPGIIAGRDPRPGDQVPCRQGDIVVGICSPGQTAKEAEIQRVAKDLTNLMVSTYQSARDREAATIAPATLRDHARQMQEIASSAASLGTKINGREIAERFILLQSPTIPIAPPPLPR